MSASQKSVYLGIGLALLTVIIWSGNFIVAKSFAPQIPPVQLAFYRWMAASIIILPIAYTKLKQDWYVIKKSIGYLTLVAFFGITLFNTFVYVGGHYTTAINLALVGTTSSPIIAIFLARIFLKESIGPLKLAGMTVCVIGVLFLLSQGSWVNLLHLRFTKGDQWVLVGAFCFAVYNVLVKKKPPQLSGLSFVGIIFCMGALLLFPAFLWEKQQSAPVIWDSSLWLVILYLGVGTSVICYLCWNYAISQLGTGRTALFGNLIPVFSSLEAVFFLNENFGWIHIISMLLVFAGIIMANWNISK